jgi:hypothetical protein
VEEHGVGFYEVFILHEIGDGDESLIHHDWTWSVDTGLGIGNEDGGGDGVKYER